MNDKVRLSGPSAGQNFAEAEPAFHLIREQLERKFEEKTQELQAANEELNALNEEVGAVNAALEELNQQLEEEVAIRQQKEADLLLRERQCRVLTSLLAGSADAGEKLLEPILQSALQLVGAQHGHIGLYSEDRRIFSVRYAIGAEKDLLGKPQPADAGLKGEVFQTGRFTYEQHYQQYPRRLQDSLSRRISSIIVAPLKQHGIIRGLMTVYWLEEVHIPQDEDLELLRQYADLASIVILQAENREKLNRSNQLLQSLAATTTALIDQLDLEKTLKLILTQATQLIGIPHGFVLLFDESAEKKLWVRCACGRYLAREGTLSPGKGITAQVLATGKLVYIADYQNWPQRVTGPFYGDITLSMQAPLIVNGTVLGTLGLSAFGEAVHLSGETLAILETVRRHCLHCPKKRPTVQKHPTSVSTRQLDRAAQSGLSDATAAGLPGFVRQ